MEGHWAGDALELWHSRGILRGYEDGSLKPDGSITRAEFAALVNRTYGLVDTKTVYFTDVYDDDWFKQDIEKAYAAGYLEGYPDGTVGPDRSITRQEATLVLARLKGLGKDAQDHPFTDLSSIPQWSKWAVMACAAEGFVEGYDDGSFGPEAGITRAETITILDRMFQEIYSEPGVYGTDEAGEIRGSVVVSSTGVTLQNLTIAGDLLIAQSVGDGEVVLKNVVVEGNTQVSGGGAHSVIVIDSSLGTVNIDKENVSLLAKGKTEIDVVNLSAAARLEQQDIEGDGIKDVVLDESLEEGTKVVLVGNFNKVEVLAGSIILELEDGRIVELITGVDADAVSIVLEEGTSVGSLTLNAPADVSGQGAIEEATINSPGSTIEQKPAKVTLGEGVTALVAGETVAPTPPATEPPYVPPVQVGAVSVTGDAVVGAILTAIPTPSDATVTYRWMRSLTTDKDGEYEVVAGVTDETYELVEEDVGKWIKVEVRGTGNYEGTVESEAVEVAEEVETFTITFDVTPAYDTVEVRDENFEVVTAESPGRYELGAGLYIYIIEKAGYEPLQALIELTGEGEEIEIKARLVTVSRLDKDYYAAGDPLQFTIGELEPDTAVRVGLPILTGMGAFGPQWECNEPVLDDMQITDEGIYWVDTADAEGKLTVSGTVRQNLPCGELHITLPDCGYYIDGAIKLRDNQGVGVRVGEPIIIESVTTAAPNADGVGDPDATNIGKYTVGTAEAIGDGYTVEIKATEELVNVVSADEQQGPAKWVGVLITTDQEATNVAVKTPNMDNFYNLVEADVTEAQGVGAEGDKTFVWWLKSENIGEGQTVEMKVQGEADETAIKLTVTFEPYVAPFVVDPAGVLTAYHGSDANVVIPDEVTAIGDNVFSQNTDIVSVSIPESVTEIGEKAFYAAINLESVTFRGNSALKTIGDKGFEQCEALTTITIPAGVTSIGKGAFAGLTALASLTIPEGMAAIPEGAFADCNALAVLVLPSSVTEIGVGAFLNSISLTSITIGADVTGVDVGSINFVRGDMESIGFIEAYDANNKGAGTYTFDGNSWTIE